MKEQEQAQEGNQKPSDGESADPAQRDRRARTARPAAGKRTATARIRPAIPAKRTSSEAAQPPTHRNRLNRVNHSRQPMPRLERDASVPNRRPTSPRTRAHQAAAARQNLLRRKRPLAGSSLPRMARQASREPDKQDPSRKPALRPKARIRIATSVPSQVRSLPAATKPRPLHKARSNPIHPASRRGIAAAAVIKGPARVHGSRKATLLAAPVPRTAEPAPLSRRATGNSGPSRATRQVMDSPPASRGKKKAPVPLPNRVNRRTLPVPRRPSQNRAIPFSSRPQGKGVRRKRRTGSARRWRSAWRGPRVFVFGGGAGQRRSQP